MISRNHENSSFAVVCVTWAAMGVPAPGAIVLGLLGAWAGDWPDIDHERATVVKSLSWIPYRFEIARDKKGNIKHRKNGRQVWHWYAFPGHQMYLLAAWSSAWVYDRCATELDRKDTNRMWGPAFRVHRGLWHSVWAAGCTGAGWWAVLSLVPIWEPLGPLFGSVAPVPVLVGATVMLGMVSHIAGDGCTDFGVAPVAPLWKWKGRRYVRMGLWEPLRFKVSKWVERKIILPLCVALAGFAVAAAWIGPWALTAGLGQLVSDVWTGLA